MKLLVVLISLFVGNAFACSCAEWGNAREMLVSAQAAFVGMPVNARRGEINPESGESFVVTSFRVLRSFKPRSMERVFTHSDQGNGGNCGTNFRTGVAYLVFAYKHEGKLYTDSCSLKEVSTSSSREMNRFLRELEYLSRQ